MPRINKKPTAMSHNGNLLLQVMRLRMMTKTELARKINIDYSGINEYCKQPSLHAALLWQLGEILNYDFFAVLSKEFPLRSASEKELELQQQLTDLKKENDLYKNLIMGKLG